MRMAVSVLEPKGAFCCHYLYQDRVRSEVFSHDLRHYLDRECNKCAWICSAWRIVDDEETFDRKSGVVRKPVCGVVRKPRHSRRGKPRHSRRGKPRHGRIARLWRRQALRVVPKPRLCRAFAAQVVARCGAWDHAHINLPPAAGSTAILDMMDGVDFVGDMDTAHARLMGDRHSIQDHHCIRNLDRPAFFGLTNPGSTCPNSLRRGVHPGTPSIH
jgi:hypothetical protein